MTDATLVPDEPELPGPVFDVKLCKRCGCGCEYSSWVDYCICCENGNLNCESLGLNNMSLEKSLDECLEDEDCCECSFVGEGRLCYSCRYRNK